MRYYIIGTDKNEDGEYNYAEYYLRLYNNSVINPKKIIIADISQEELKQIKMRLLAFSDGVLVLENAQESYELDYAKALGKKIKYFSKQWKIKKKLSNETYRKENL